MELSEFDSFRAELRALIVIIQGIQKSTLHARVGSSMRQASLCLRLFDKLRAPATRSDLRTEYCRRSATCAGVSNTLALPRELASATTKKDSSALPCKKDRRDLTVGRIGNESKRLAVSLNIPFILLSQLNRKSEDLSDPEPSCQTSQGRLIPTKNSNGRNNKGEG